MYQQPANTAAVSGQTISSTAFNTLETDIGNEITNSLDRGGRSAMTAALPMGSNKITGMADPTVSTDAATKNYVDTTTAAFFSTGDVKLTIKTSPDSGWLLFDDGTFGSATSGSSNSNSANNQALFTLFFNNMTDTAAPMFTSTGSATTRGAQGSASAAWAANCRMSLPKMLGRALAISGTGSGLSARALGSSTGAETVTLAANQIPTITSTGSFASSQTGIVNVSAATTQFSANAGSQVWQAWKQTDTVQQVQITGPLSVTYPNGSPTAVSIIPPIVYLNAMIKQ